MANFNPYEFPPPTASIVERAIHAGQYINYHSCQLYEKYIRSRGPGRLKMDDKLARLYNLHVNLYDVPGSTLFDREDANIFDRAAPGMAKPKWLVRDPTSGEWNHYCNMSDRLVDLSPFAQQILADRIAATLRSVQTVLFCY